jgi:hypothetical protein
MKTETSFEPLLVSKKQAKELLGNLSIRSIEYAIASGALVSRVVGRRRLISYRSLVAFAQRDHPGPLAGDSTAIPAPADGGQQVAAR